VKGIENNWKHVFLFDSDDSDQDGNDDGENEEGKEGMGGDNDNNKKNGQSGTNQEAGTLWNNYLYGRIVFLVQCKRNSYGGSDENDRTFDKKALRTLK